ncbi:MAG TPA: UDP-N-acetylglucosamine 4,6-dehydratase (inverting) [Oligoflexia bacterium]|nr:UDP-N-acetylglucosamine 4,6-dehydratase (inverting) [Oligoflexia bacterium]HMP48514.1 UDP-N-acetylglucosamine 4,6-dehydratase (inverting) [Oligoflexia bacterium]
MDAESIKIDHSFLHEKSILITGGTGSFGKALTEYLLKNCPTIKRLVIFSRDEQKQFEMSQIYPSEKFPQIRFFIGDVRDRDRLKRAFNNIDFVIHAAAMKHVHIAEYNPDECVKTNIGGAENVIHSALSAKVSRVVALSTDKACSPVNLYGATKLASDKLFIAANTFKGKEQVRFSVVRYGNVLGSNGSVIPFFLKKKKEGILPITNSQMTRFNITLTAGVKMVLLALEQALGGELFVPKIPSYKILDVAEAIGPECEKPVIGTRPGEKIHEEMISPSDSFNTYDFGNYYIIYPGGNDRKFSDHISSFEAKKVPEGFNYRSDNNTQWETVDSLRNLIKQYCLEKERSCA